MMPYVAAISSILFSGLASLFMITMLCMGGANSSPEQIRQLKFWIISIITVGLLCLIGSIWALVIKRAWWGAGIGLAPTLVCIAAFIGIWRMGR
ncbi:MAG: hypothetical protein KGS45_06970 [Planctomycetes bacterium]|nr:hypothetical protein [Planctomycetota bacterium]